LASWLHSSYKGKIKVGEQLLIALVGVTIGLLLSLPLLWLSWKIPQQLLMEGSELHLLTSSEPAMCGLQWQDVLFVSLLCVCASSAALLWGLEVETFVAFAFCAVLLLLARIDARTHLLPDVLTQPLLWLGLLWHAAGLGERSLELAVWGAAAGYIVLWLPAGLLGAWLGKTLMGHGDFKLSAAIGAWLGCWALPFVWLLACTSSMLIVALSACFGGRRLREPMPFGPGLALGGILMLFFDTL
jgi:prepilin signal peptidase PulO-like enzyme (type II secretory pathway)